MATPPVFTAGQILTAAQMNQAGLWLIKTDTITSGTSKEITGVFSSDFENYRIVVTNASSSAAVGLRLRLGTTATGIYYFGGTYVAFNSTSVTGEGGSATTSFQTGLICTTTNRASALIELQMPNKTATTSIETFGIDARTNGTGGRHFSGFVNDSTAYTSFTLLFEGGATFTTCDVAVYGYRN